MKTKGESGVTVPAEARAKGKFSLFDQSTLTLVKLSIGAGIYRLTLRELEVLWLTAKGSPQKLIGVELGIAEGTVSAHLDTVYKRLGTHTATETVAVLISQS